MAEVFRHGPTRPADRLMLLAIADHANDEDLAWPGLARLAEKCAVGVRAASATIKRLEAAGWLHVTRGSGRQTSIYRLCLQHPRGAAHVTSGVQPTSPKPSVEPPVEPPTTADAGAPGVETRGSVVASTDHQPHVLAAEREQMSTARAARPAPTDEPLMGMPEPEQRTPEPNAGELVAAWCSGWSDAHGGAQPHGSVVRRVAGVCKNVAKDCADIEEWRAAWRAAAEAGRAGRYDVVAHLAAPAALGRQNHHLALARDPDQLTSGGLLGAMLAAPPRGPRALGGAS